jgi:predicted chitinase
MSDLDRFWTRLEEDAASTATTDPSHRELRCAVGDALRKGDLVLAAPIGALTVDQLKAIVPGVRDDDCTRAIAPLNAAMSAYGIDTAPKRAAFLAQIAVESQSLHRLEEGLYYTHADRLQSVFKRRLFPTLESAAPYLKHPQKLANYVYARKNGNRDATDGWTYRGRGYIQITGRANYAAAGYESNPDALAEPDGAADAAASYWETNGLNAASQTWLDRIPFDQTITEAVNAAGLEAEQRWRTYQRAKTAFGG